MWRSSTLLLCAVGALAPAFAQTGSAPESQNQVQGGAAPQAHFITRQATNDWRGSKIVGVTIYGQNDEKVGDVSEILVNDQGQVHAVVIGVGGFLGIGEKNVAVPFTAIRWVTVGATSSTGFSSTGRGTTASGTQGGTPPQNLSTSPDAFVITGGIPNHPVLALTKRDLENAPAFQYAGRDEPKQGNSNTSSNRLEPPTTGAAPSR
jgi:sporulation protein YlmC with PRC-barrel domain